MVVSGDSTGRFGLILVQLARRTALAGTWYYREYLSGPGGPVLPCNLGEPLTLRPGTANVSGSPGSNARVRGPVLRSGDVRPGRWHYLLPDVWSDLGWRQGPFDAKAT